MLATLAALAFQTKDLTSTVQAVVKDTVAQFSAQGAKPDNIGITLYEIDRASGRVAFGTYRGDTAVYPASVVKLFYIVYLADRVAQKKIRFTPELERAARDMIVDSSNDATGLILDVLTGTTGGPDLTGRAWLDWQNRRRTVNRFYESLGYKETNVCQKTWNEGPYGRERAFYGPNFENRNRISPNACARLMAEITGVQMAGPSAIGSVSAERMDWVRSFLKRKVAGEGELDSQTKEFSGEALPARSVLHSKAGWTSSTRHDVAWVKLPDGREYVWAIMTTGKENAANTKIIPWIARRLLGEQ